MLSKIDDFLNKITMYRLALYCLIFLWLAGCVFSFFGVMPFTPMDLIFSSIALFASCFLINKIFQYLFRAPSNTESTPITALILTLIVGPEKSFHGFLLLFAVSALAVSSKYILAIHKKHVFNPAAFSVAFSAYTIHYYASWWVGNIYMVPLVIATGILITRKLQRTDLVASFLTVYAVVSLWGSVSLQTIIFSIKDLLAYSPIFFLAFIMLTEPMTTPPKRKLRIAYGFLVGILLAPFAHLGSFYFSPESALIAGNIFSFLVSPKRKLLLTLKEKINIATSVHEFVFRSNHLLQFQPGQYMEWTLKHLKQDNRGMRRYFTIASSPTEDDVKIGIKFYDPDKSRTLDLAKWPNRSKPSSYKKVLEGLNIGDQIVASQLAGEFTMPPDASKKLIFLAGGIGITPFRSMVKYLIDTNEKRDIIIFYANNSYSDIAYKEIFDTAKKNLSIKTIYAINNPSNVPNDFTYEKGFISQEMIKEKAPDFKERMFYISGPRTMIVSFKKTLREMGIHSSHIKTDFFPGFA